MLIKTRNLIIYPAHRRDLPELYKSNENDREIFLIRNDLSFITTK